MEINIKPLSLFNYIADYNKSNDVLESVVNKGQFEETLKRLEKVKLILTLT